MDIKNNLKILDLSDKEIEVYLACLEFGFINVKQLSRKTFIKRTTIYDILDNLEKKELIGQAKEGKKRLFYANEPIKLVELLDKKRQQIFAALPELNTLYQEGRAKSSARFIEGFDELKNLFDDLFTNDPNNEIHVLGVNELLKRDDFIEFFKFYHSKRKEHKIKLNLMLTKKIEKLFKEKYIKVGMIYKTDEVKYVNFTFPSGVFIFKDWVINIMADDKVTAYILKSKENADRYRKYFYSYWQKIK
jgi:sugar-specific transcriptional regulator TrmB